jgi:dihydropteroate synthase
MLRLLDWGIAGINDIAGGAPKETLKKLSVSPSLNYIAMHMIGEPADMQLSPLDGDEAVLNVSSFFKTTYQNLLDAGFNPKQIFLDPGIGFGKTDRANLLLIDQVRNWAKTYQIAIGVSRKSFMGRILGISGPAQRDPPSKMVEMGLALAGASIIRTHSIKALSNIHKILNPD